MQNTLSFLNYRRQTFDVKKMIISAFNILKYFRVETSLRQFDKRPEWLVSCDVNLKRLFVIALFDCLASITSLYMKYGGSDTIQCLAIKFSITTNDKDIYIYIRCLGTYKVHGKQSFWNFLSFRFKGNVNMVMSCHVLDLFLNVINERVRYVLIVLSFQS